jgi:hypothetical protein
MEELTEVVELLGVPLDTDNGSVLVAQLADVEAWQGLVSNKYRAAQALLAQNKSKFLLPKSKDWTDMDRTIQLEASVGEFQADVDRLRDMQEQIQRRISLGQTMLRGIRAEIDSNVRTV